MKKIMKQLDRVIVRPLIYMTFTRFGFGLCAALLLDFFIVDSMRSIKTYAFTFLTVFFAMLAWIAWLRLDGYKLPKLFMKRFNLKKKPVRTYGDMIDYVDEEIVSFDELEEGQKDVCCLFADCICCLLFLAFSLFWI